MSSSNNSSRRFMRSRNIAGAPQQQWVHSLVARVVQCGMLAQKFLVLYHVSHALDGSFIE